MSQPSILAVITEPGARTTALGLSEYQSVQAHLPEGVMLRIDPARLPDSREGLSVEQQDGRLIVKYGGRPLNPGAVWWRPAIPQVEDETLRASLARNMAPGLLESHGEVAQRLVKRHARVLRSVFPSSRYVNPPDAIERTGDRPYHLQLAAALGFAVLDWLLTADPSEARAWVHARFAAGERVLWKVPEHVFFAGPDGQRLKFGVPTELLPSEAANWEWESIRISPRFFQTLGEGPDVRVTVVGERVFAVKLTPTGELGKVRDLRAYRPRYEPFELTGAQQEACRRLLCHLGLVHGELDFKLLGDGQLVFLEVQGDGAWLETERTGQPVGDAFARLLMRTAARAR